MAAWHMCLQLPSLFVDKKGMRLQIHAFSTRSIAMDRVNYRRSNTSKASAIAVMMVKSSVVPLSVFMSCPPCPWFVRIVTPFETRSPLHLNPLQR